MTHTMLAFAACVTGTALLVFNDRLVAVLLDRHRSRAGGSTMMQEVPPKAAAAALRALEWSYRVWLVLVALLFYFLGARGFGLL